MLILRDIALSIDGKPCNISSSHFKFLGNLPSNVKQYVRTQECVIGHPTAEKDKDIEKFHIDQFSPDTVTQSTTELGTRLTSS